jgi:hypothetical protein
MGRSDREREKYTLTEEQLDKAVGEVIQAIERYFTESMFNFPTNLSANSGRHGDHPWLEDCVALLDPYARRLKDKLSEHVNEPNKPYPSNAEDDFTQLCMRTEVAGFAVGILMGARFMGASDDKLNFLRKHMFI